VLNVIGFDALTTFNQSSPTNWRRWFDSRFLYLPSGTGKPLQRLRGAI
jgi:hypothetical protein